MSKQVVILSGGMDSAVLAYDCVKNFGAGSVCALSFDYGQRHKVELESAYVIAQMLGIDWKMVDLSKLAGSILKGSSQTDPEIEVPHGHYADETMKTTVVPNRNMIMLSIAAGYALSIGGDLVFFGAHSGDHAIYPDCRPEFVDSLSAALQNANYDWVQIIAPFISMTKAEIVTLGASLNVPFAVTYSCYEGRDGIHCGLCGTCVERREAFQLANVPDPTQYESLGEENAVPVG